MLRFVVPTSVSIANQVGNEMLAEASTTDATVKLKPLRFNQAPSTPFIEPAFGTAPESLPDGDL